MRSPLKYKPVLVTKGDWRRLFYKWFRLGDLAVPIVFKNEVEDGDNLRFHIMETPDVRKLPKESLPGYGVLKEIVREEEIVIEDASPGKPLMVKISYHPNWKVEGAEKIYLVSPAFMLIYPESSKVRLYFGRTWPDYVGASMTALGILFILFASVYDMSGKRDRMSSWFDRYCLRGFLVFMGIAIVAAAYYLIRLSPEFPVLSYNKGIQYFTQKDFSKARQYFKEVLQRFPQTLIVDQAAYHYAMCFFREKKWDHTIRALKSLLQDYPETGRAGEVLYHMGLCYMNLGKTGDAREYFSRTMNEFPDQVWAQFAKDRLKEIQGR